MSVKRSGDRPFKPGGTNTHRSRKKLSRSEERATEAAERRYRVVTEALTEIEENGYNRREAHAVLRDRYRNAADPFDVEPPALSTYYEWMRKADQEDRLSIQTFRGKKKPGRPLTQLDRDVEEYLLKRLDSGVHRSRASLYRRVGEWAGDRAPSQHVFNRFLDSLDPGRVSAALHGSRAAISDSMAKLTIPVDYPHQYWALDETRLPIYIQAWDTRHKKLASVKPWAAPLLECFSRACLALQVFRPFAHGTPGGYDSADILGLFYSAALPEVALGPCREFTGYLPEELRMDNHKTHEELRELLVEKHRVTVGNLRVQNAWANGLVEAFNDTLKEMCAEEEIPGLDHKYLPADRAREDPRSTRTKAAGYTSVRQSRRIIVAVEDLLTYEELIERLAVVVRKYNEREHSGIENRTPQDVYHSRLRRESKARDAFDAVAWLKPRTVTMSTRLRVAGENFAPSVNGRELRKGEKVVCRLEPLKRGLWVTEGDEIHWVPTLKEHARLVQPGEAARDERAKARAWSDQAQDTLEEHVDEALGRGTVARGKHAARDIIDHDDEDSEDGEDEVAKRPPARPRRSSSVRRVGPVSEGNGGEGLDNEDEELPRRTTRLKPYKLGSFGNRIKTN